MKLPTLHNMLILLFISLLLTACSTKQEPKASTEATNANKQVVSSLDEDEFSDEFEEADEEVYDPLEGYNRWMTAVNDNFYTYLFNPVSEGYAIVVPKPARIGISNAVDNLKFPIRFTNNVLQLKFDASIKELARFMINSTIGIVGLFDVAKGEGIEPQDEDFGQTLGHYGVGSGFHVVLPFFGPSNLRDAIGLSIDTAMSPTSNSALSYQAIDNTEKAIGLSSIYYINKNSLHPGEYENLKKDALDVYTFFRDSYEQMRTKEIAK